MASVERYKRGTVKPIKLSNSCVGMACAELRWGCGLDSMVDDWRESERPDEREFDCMVGLRLLLRW